MQRRSPEIRRELRILEAAPSYVLERPPFRRRTRESNHRPVVIRIHLGSKQQHALGRPNRLLDRLDRRLAPSFRKIRNTLDQLTGHFTSDRSTRIAPAFITRFTMLTPK